MESSVSKVESPWALRTETFITGIRLYTIVEAGESMKDVASASTWSHCGAVGLAGGRRYWMWQRREKNWNMGGQVRTSRSATTCTSFSVPVALHQTVEQNDHAFTCAFQILCTSLLAQPLTQYHAGKEILGKIVPNLLNWQDRKPLQ